MTPPRVALVTMGDIGEVFSDSGVATSSLRIARGLHASGRFRIDLVALRPDLDADPRDDFLAPEPIGVDDSGVCFYELRAPRGTAYRAERDYAVQMALINLCRRHGYALLHSFFGSTAGFCSVYAALECEVPSVVSLRGNDIHRDVMRGERFGHLLWALQNTTRVTAVSSDDRRKADLLVGCAAKSLVILNGGP